MTDKFDQGNDEDYKDYVLYVRAGDSNSEIAVSKINKLNLHTSVHVDYIDVARIQTLGLRTVPTLVASKGGARYDNIADVIQQLTNIGENELGTYAQTNMKPPGMTASCGSLLGDDLYNTQETKPKPQAPQQPRQPQYHAQAPQQQPRQPQYQQPQVSQQPRQHQYQQPQVSQQPQYQYQQPQYQQPRQHQYYQSQQYQQPW